MSNDRIAYHAGTAVRGDGDSEDPRVAGLRLAVARLRRELAGYRPQLSDREVAEDELAALTVQASSGKPVTERLRRSLLVVTGALGSVSALAPALAEMRRAIDLFGSVPASGKR